MYGNIVKIFDFFFADFIFEFEGHIWYFLKKALGAMYVVPGKTVPEGIFKIKHCSAKICVAI